MIVDFHSHVLPGIDDGSSSAEESLEMLRMMKEQGISRVVATPHFYASHDRPERFLERRDRALEELLAAIGDEELPEIIPAAEVLYFRGMSRSGALQDLVIKGTRAILVEMPMGTWTSSMYDELEDIRKYQGLTPVIAHVDRYISPWRDYGIPRKLAQLSVLVQANAGFFLRRNTMRKALHMLADDQIQLLGSDCHNITDRPPNLGAALEVIRTSQGEEALHVIAGWQKELLNGIV